MKNLLVSFLVLLFSTAGGTSLAAARLDFATVDMLTYRCYQQKKWDSVILVGKQALRVDIDYYYLRVRMGIAYFEKREYFPSVTHLKKARQFNSQDPEVAAYLYYAYLNSNRADEAAMIRSRAREANVNLGDEPGVVQEIHAEGGYTVSSDRNPGNLAILMEKDSIYGEEDLYGNNFYSNLGLTLRASKRVGITLAYNYLNFNRTKYIQYGRAEAHLDTIVDNPFSRDYFYSFPWKIHDTSFKYHVVQHEGYLNASVTGPWDLKIVPAIHFIHVGYSPVNPQLKYDSIDDTAYYSKFDSTYHLFRYRSTGYSFNQSDTSFNNWVVSLGISKDYGIFRVGISGSWANLNGMKQKQIGAMLTYYPLGNLDLYGVTTLTGFFQERDKRLLFSQVVGVKITPWMWGEANFYYGDYTNANIFNGSVVYNNSDIINYRCGVTLAFVAGKHLRLSLIYQYFRKENLQLYYVKSTDPYTHEINEIPQIKNNPYYTHTIITGITWKL